MNEKISDVLAHVNKWKDHRPASEMARMLIAAVDSAGQDSHDSANVVATEVIMPGTIIKPITEDEMKMELIAAADSAEQDSPDPANVAWPEGITPGTIITPIMADEMETESIAAADSAGQWSPDPANVVTTEVITLATVITPISQEVVAPESDSSEAILVDNAPMFGEAFAKTESGGRRVLLVFGALLLLAVGVAGLL